jgi:hypothetical protein
MLHLSVHQQKTLNLDINVEKCQAPRPKHYLHWQRLPRKCPIQRQRLYLPCVPWVMRQKNKQYYKCRIIQGSKGKYSPCCCSRYFLGKLCQCKLLVKKCKKCFVELTLDPEKQYSLFFSRGLNHKTF